MVVNRDVNKLGFYLRSFFITVHTILYCNLINWFLSRIETHKMQRGFV